MKSWMDLNLSELVSQSLAMGVLPVFNFVDKDTVQVGEREVNELSIIEQTPVSVLEKEVRYYKRMITRIRNKEGITVTDETAEQKLAELIIRLEEKTKTFEAAAVLLNSEQGV